jgi:hypothetical protein
MTATYERDAERIYTVADELNLKRERLLQLEPGALVLPAVANDKHLVFAAYSKEIAERLSSSGLPARLYDDGRERRDLIRKSADVILPVLAVVGKTALEISCGVIGAWIYDRFLRGASKEQPTIQVEILSVDLAAGAITKHRIKGPAGDVQRLLDGGLTSDTAESDSDRAQLTVNDGNADSNCTPSAPQARAAYESAKACQREGTLLLVEQDTRAAEQRFRNALEHLRTAYLLDGRPRQLSREMHALGRRVQAWFSCPLEFHDGEYRNACPVYLSHYVGGFSIGGTGTVICSICGLPMLECDHVPGERYENVVARKTSGGLCSICAAERCDHEVGTAYGGVIAFGIMTDIEPDHIAYVSRPEDPLCTFYAVPLSKTQVERQLPPAEFAQFVYGNTQLYCTHCQQCEG